MPLTRKGVTFNDAYLEAAAIANVRYAMLDTLEISHPLLPDVLRVVNDHVPLIAGIEPGAPNDAGLSVEFLACQFGLKPAEESDGTANPDSVIEIDNVSGGICAALRLIRGSLEPLILIGRVYASDSTSLPARLPVTTVEARIVEIKGATVLLTCNFGDAGNVAIPALTFKRAEYPGLAR